MRYITINGKTLDIYKAENIKNTDYGVISAIEQNQTGVAKYYMVAKNTRIIEIMKMPPFEGKADLSGEVMLLTMKEFAERMKQVASLQQRIEQLFRCIRKELVNTDIQKMAIVLLNETNQVTGMSLKSTYDGKFWKIYYFDLQSSKDYKTSDLETNLPDALKFLDSLNENEEVLAIIPDTGQVDTLLAGHPSDRRHRICYCCSKEELVCHVQPADLSDSLPCSRLFS